MKHIKSFVLVLMTILIPISTIYAAPIGTGVKCDGQPVNYDAAGNANISAHDYNSSNNFSLGVRLSFVKSDGTLVHSKDYLYQSSSDLYTQYGSGSPCSKVQYGNGTCTYNDNWSKTSNMANLSALQSIFTRNGISVSLSSLLSQGDLSKMSLFKTLLTSPNAKAKSFFKSLGVDIDNEEYYKNGSYDLFLVWEPLGQINYNGLKLIGTSYELSTMASKENVNFNINGQPFHNGYDFVYTATAASLGRAVILENTDTFGLSVAKKYSSFSANSYFNGALNNSFVCNGCGAKATKDVALDPHSGLGVGILWLDELTIGGSCEDIYKYYGKTTINTALKNNQGFDFSAFNNSNKAVLSQLNILAVTETWYRENCCELGECDGGGGGQYNCSVQFEVPNCDDGGSVIYKDASKTDGTNETYWQNCVFNDNGNHDDMPGAYKTSKNGDLTYYEDSLGSEYCPVYCIEDVTATLDSTTPTVLAGNYFTWGESNVTSSRTCRTKKVDWDKFLSDLEAANREVVRQQAQQHLHDLNEGGSWIAGNDKYEDDWDDCKVRNPRTGDCITPGSKYECTNYTYSGTGSTTASGAGFTESANVVLTKCEKSEPQGNPAAAGDVDAAIKNVQTIIAKFKKCYDWDAKTVLNDESTADILYDSSEYSYSGKMNKTNSLDPKTNLSESKDTKVNALNACSGTSCTGEDFVKETWTITSEGQKIREYNMTATSTSDFRMPEGIYNYVIKAKHGHNSLSVMNTDLSTNYVNLGFTNFPVAFNEPIGVHDNGLQIMYSLLGNKNSKSSQTMVDQILESNSDDYGNWSCKYIVDSGLICPPGDPECPGGKPGGKGGINVIYREIDLIRPFPDIDATNRRTGSNWCGLDKNGNSSCAWDNTVATHAIMNNRGVSDYEVYNKTPMYTFIMTPSDIIEIRKYNKENDYTAYEGGYGASKYNFTCSSGAVGNKACISDYLTELMKMMDTYNYDGACKDDKTRAYTDIASFENCRY